MKTKTFKEDLNSFMIRDKYKQASDLSLKEEYTIFQNYLKVYIDDEGIITTISLKDDVTLKEFKEQFNISRKELLYFFDEIEKRKLTMLYLNTFNENN